MLLYDPMPNLLSMMPKLPLCKSVYRLSSTPSRVDFDSTRRMHVFTGHAGWFGDHTATHIRNVLFPMTRRRHMLFVSDIRAKTGEHFIAQDMLSQQRWAIKLGAHAYMFKFRIPYPESPQEASALTILYDDAYNQLAAQGFVSKLPSDPEPHSSSIPYLDGNLYIQLYGRPRTAELRLIGARRGHTYGMRRYSLTEIEDKMAVFNYVYRTHAAYKRDGAVLPATYESAAEWAIVTGCAKTSKCCDAADLHALIEAIMSSVIADKDGVACSLLSAIKDLRARPRQDIMEYVWSCYSILKDKISSPNMREKIESKLATVCRYHCLAADRVLIQDAGQVQE